MSREKKKKNQEVKRAIEIPEFLIGEPLHLQEAYIEWCELDHTIRTHPDRFQEIIHPDNPSETIEVDLINAYPSVRNNIYHLSEKEQSKIKEKWGRIQSLKSKKGRLKVLWSQKKYKGKNNGVIDIKATQILELFGQWYTVDEVFKTVVHDWGYEEITRDELYKFSVANKLKIAKLREKWENGFNDHFITKKRGRIQTLSYLLQTQSELYKTEHYPLSRSREIRGIVEQVRKEIEGDKIALEINGQINIDLTLQLNKSMKKIAQQLSINRIIVGLVAARMGTNPERLITMLERSFYSKYNGFKGVLKETEEQDPLYHPSKLIYDWQMIEHKHKNNLIEDVQYEELELEVDSDKERKRVEDKRQKLLELIDKGEEKIGKIKRDQE